MKHELPVEDRIIDVVATLQEAGFETYIVGGAIRDLLLGRKPKDYDISTSATPEEVRAVFGRRSARIIGRRFRLVHLFMRDREIIEISTFRRAPQGHGREVDSRTESVIPENIILSDNDYGTSAEDAMRRDFTVNSLFYDPVKSELIDHTGMGIDDIRNGIIRAIGDAGLRFEEDPVRMLRALKLAGQYDFTMDAVTENALFASLPLIRHASPSRLSLELEKILSSPYGDKHLQAFHDYGFLHYFLPHFDELWGTPEMEYALDLLTERNFRVDEGLYRNSISLAMAVLVLPLAEKAAGCRPGDLWAVGKVGKKRIAEMLESVFLPNHMMNCMQESAIRILQLQPVLREMNPDDLRHLPGERGYAHARELIAIQNEICWHDEDLLDFWPPARNSRHKNRRPPRRRPPAGQGHNPRTR